MNKARWAAEIHIVLDNLSAHKTKAVQAFLQENPKLRFHFTPTYSSWLNQVELWFAKIQRDVNARGVSTSVADLARKLRKYIRAYAKSAKPFRWTTLTRNDAFVLMNSPGQLTSSCETSEVCEINSRVYHSLPPTFTLTVLNELLYEESD